jgi:hypothetical protein
VCQADSFYADPPGVEAAAMFLRDFLNSGVGVVRYRDGLLALMGH